MTQICRPHRKISRVGWTHRKYPMSAPQAHLVAKETICFFFLKEDKRKGPLSKMAILVCGVDAGPSNPRYNTRGVGSITVHEFSRDWHQPTRRPCKLAQSLPERFIQSGTAQRHVMARAGAADQRWLHYIQQGVVNALVSSFTNWQLARQIVPLLGLNHAKEGQAGGGLAGGTVCW